MESAQKDFDQQSINKARVELDKASKVLKDFEIQWSLLTSKEKNYYKFKVMQKRQKYEEIRVQFFKLEDEALKSDLNKEQMKDLRHKVTKNTGDISFDF